MKDTEIKMTLKKSTKGTNVYEAPESAIPSVYIRKEHSPSPTPGAITVTIKWGVSS